MSERGTQREFLEALLRLKSCPPWQEALKLVRNGARKVGVEGLSGAARGLLAAAAAQETGRPVVAVVPDLEQARDLFSDAREFFPRRRVFLFPDRDLAPYQPGPVSPQLSSSRLLSLQVLPDLESGVVVTTASALHEALPEPSRLKAFELELTPGGGIDREEILHHLVAAGYRRVDVVELAGDFSVRGAIVDVFCPALARPVRLELDGDTACSLRYFDPGTQRSLEDAGPVTIGPAAEALLTHEERMELLARLPDPLSQRGAQRVGRLKERLETGASLEGEERYIPWLLGGRRADGKSGAVRLPEYLPRNALVMLCEPEEVSRASEMTFARVRALYEELTRAREPLPRAEEFCAPPAEAHEDLGAFVQIMARQFAHVSRIASFSLGGRPLRYGIREFSSFARDLVRWQSVETSVIVACEAPEEREALNSRLKDEIVARHDLRPPSLTEGRLSAGCDLAAARIVLLPARDVLGQPVRRAPPKRPPKAYRDVFADLKVGEPVVHEDYGIGLYRGVMAIPIDSVKQDFFLIEYADEEKLYLPVDQVHRVQKYLGADRAPQLSRLGTEAWERTKARVKASLRKFAEELLKLYAARQVAPARAFAPHTEVEAEFARGFPYEETPDQSRAIAEVGEDLGLARPMDRLVCGDVGYGKTEVALRAAFRVAMQGAQVAVLVPTTILAQQHYENFRNRLSGTPVSVEMLSRFRGPDEKRKILTAVVRGKVDVLVGTHQLLANSVKFRDLGLLVIDEEHRFGVKQKEKLKEMRRNVHVLTLTATPIPRTLNMGLSGMRDLSVIETPPPGRLSIVTHVNEDNPQAARQAILRELERGGQVFYLHNRVSSLAGCAERVRELVPEAKLAVAHGQMPQRQLAKAMVEFSSGRADVLVCTSIIGAGLDLPNANTLIVERADQFGLADLYQLRGRIGRSVRQAYAYFFFSRRGVPTLDARRRLAAMLEFGELGSGFRLAVRDLEIRGAGNLLGPQQHGAMLAVGFDLYTRILEAAVRELKGEVIVEETPPQLTLAMEAYLPETYVADGRSKLEIYKRMAACREERELEELGRELQDRFGEPPAPARLLTEQARLRILGTAAGVESVVRRGDEMTLKFRTREAMQAALSRAGSLKIKASGLSLTFAAPGGPNELLSRARSVLGAEDGRRAESVSGEREA